MTGILPVISPSSKPQAVSYTEVLSVNTPFLATLSILVSQMIMVAFLLTTQREIHPLPISRVPVKEERMGCKCNTHVIEIHELYSPRLNVMARKHLIMKQLLTEFGMNCLFSFGHFKSKSCHLNINAEEGKYSSYLLQATLIYVKILKGNTKIYCKIMRLEF